MHPHGRTVADAPVKQRLELRPNRSLTGRGRTAVFLSFAAATVVLGFLFLATGAWPVVLFLFLELAGIGYVLTRTARDAGDCEEIVVEDDRMKIIQHAAGRVSQHEFQCYWAKVALEPAGRGRRSAKLLIGSHGRALEIGRALQESEKYRLAQRLGLMVGPAHRDAPPLRGEIIFNSCEEDTHGNFAPR
ncbi:MAG: DUF2244 domain-containing protein [Gammaproteobacteria bacterium]|nr:DUF2244 domain-containing protein [Gammaproteobacteria bacterium]